MRNNISSEATPHKSVGLALAKSEETTATIEYMASDVPHVTIQDRGTYYLLESESEIRVPFGEVSEFLGRELSLGGFLVSMSAYFGRTEVDDNEFVVTASAELPNTV